MGRLSDDSAAPQAGSSVASLVRFNAALGNSVFEFGDADPVKLDITETTDAGYVPADEPGVGGGSAAGKYRITAPEDGTYALIVQFDASNLDAKVSCQVAVTSALPNYGNATVIVPESDGSAGLSQVYDTITGEYYLAEGDSLQFFVFPNGASVAAGTATMRASLRRVADLPVFL